MSDLDVFENRWTITASLSLETPLRIGGGQNASMYSISAAPVIQTYNALTQMYEPYIPGSSLKGVLRSSVERLVRTFNTEKSCLSINSFYDRVNRSEKTLCGECNTCSMFGSMKSGAKIRVRDAHLSKNTASSYGIVKEQPHCATKYDTNFKLITKLRYIGKKKIETADTFLRFEEIVTSGLCFDLMIDIDNANEIEAGLILLALDEFNNKRIQLGGGSSRGNGFAKVDNISIIKKSIDDSLIISKTPFGFDKLKTEGKRYLKSIDSNKDSDQRYFDVFYKAHSKDNSPEGHIVALMKVTTLTDFVMPGAEEETVTSGGLPVIPGSTIKGFFRHNLINNKDVKTETIKEIFGFTEEKDHRGRLLVSDAWSDDIQDPKKIPGGSVLKMWLVFDNMTSNEVDLIDEFIQHTRNTVTGKTSSKLDISTKVPKFNTVRMEYEKRDIFRTSTYLAGV